MYDRAFWQLDFVFMLVLLQRVCTHTRPGILETSHCINVCVVVEGMYTCRGDVPIQD